MSELNLKEKFVRKSRYKSYKGTVGKVVKNRLNRHFHTTYFLQKLVTDVTEFKYTNNEKLYLSPIMDLYNGEILGFSMSKRPTLDFVIDSLKTSTPNYSRTCPIPYNDSFGSGLALSTSSMGKSIIAKQDFPKYVS